MSRIATVFGGTGLQGLSVVNALLKDGTFVPRAVTRNANSDSARALAARGCQIAEANMGDKEAVKRALAGAECAFGVTVPFTPLSETVQGKNMMDAAEEEGVKFFVLSSLPSLAELSGGKFTKASHFEEKAKLATYLKASGLPNACIVGGFFLENFMTTVPIKKTTDGYHIKSRPDLNCGLNANWISRDMGLAVTALMKNYTDKLSDINNQDFHLGIVAAKFGEVLDIISKELGKPITVERVYKLGFEPVDEMIDFYLEFDRYKDLQIPDPRLEALGVKQGTIEGFVQQVLKPYLDAQKIDS
ncbi:hypothetical protein BD626DRAFT_554341 [Schizophyllum amplum]|uniref:NmrA-like domain-containing protein n=1 Tax=Schizophyllum amplum TaxID=97359 RepID=A0A550CZD2_9AGAR|nr:hypothetical protein BD626DRAFT_554341 [Auriculariopsis ampla]